MQIKLLTIKKIITYLNSKQTKLVVFFFLFILPSSFCQTKNEIEEKVTTILMKIVGKSYEEDKNEYGEAEKVSGYRWATEIKNGKLIFAASIKKDVRPLNTTEFTSHQSYDVICYFPLQYYERIIKLENGFRIWSNESSSCKKVKKNLVFVDDGKTFKAGDTVEYFQGFDLVNEGGELSEEDISLLDVLLKKLKATL
jgi:hypothetical protein